MRLDLFLTARGLCRSRTEAKSLIEAAKVLVDGKAITKPSYDIDESFSCDISLDRSDFKFVSRGGLKLDGALDSFCVDLNGRICLDVGASSGGFTDCLLQRGASLVLAVDSGQGQLNDSLASDERVISYENFNARYMSASSFDYTPTLAVMDVSFISATLIMPAVYSVLPEGADYILLVKPQFEVGRAHIGKGGIVKDKKAREKALVGVVEFGKSIGFTYVNSVVSPIEGGDGNTEYLVHFRK